MKKRVEKNKNILLFITGTYLITWILWIAAFRMNGIFRIIGSFVPSGMGLLLTWRENGNSGLKKITDQCRRYQIRWYVYVFVMTYTIMSFGMPYFITGFFQKEKAFQISKSISGIDISSPWMAVACFLLILVAGGPLGEELGWRGYLLPSLEKRFSVVLSGAMVGVVWACWHLPMFLFHVEGYQMSFFLYLFQTVLFSLICTWVYHRSGNSLFIVILFHTTDNFICSIAYQSMLNGKNLYTAFYWGIQIIIVTLICIDLRRTEIKTGIKKQENN